LNLTLLKVQSGCLPINTRWSKNNFLNRDPKKLLFESEKKMSPQLLCLLLRILLDWLKMS
jgi:hypothetical protein